MRLIPFTVAWLCGILLGRWLWQAGWLGCATPAWHGLALAGAAALIAWLLRRRGRALRYGILPCLLLLGAWRYQVSPLAACAGPGDLAYYLPGQGQSRWVSVEGWVSAYPDVRDRVVYYRVRAERLTAGGQSRAVGGDVQVLAPPWPRWGYGDRLAVTGVLEAPPSLAGFDYPAYLAQQGIFSRLRAGQITRLAGSRGSPLLAVLYDWRSRGVALIDRSLPEPAAALADGMLLGVEGSIPPGVEEAFKATGTAHVIVISGSNIALLSGYLLAGLGRLLGRRRALLPALTAIAAYVALAGGDVSAVRAGLMAAVYLGAGLTGRQSLPLLALAAATLAMTVANPLTLFDVGFQLSALATLGLVLFASPWQQRFTAFCRRHLPAAWAAACARLAGDAVLVSLAAQVMTLPLIACYFGRLSAVSLLANFLILPVQPAILLGGMALLLAGAAWPPLAALIAPLPWLCLAYTTAIVQLLAGLPGATVAIGTPGPTAAVIYYAALALALAGAWLARTRQPAFLSRRPAAWLVALALPALVAAAAGGDYLARRGDGRLHLRFVPAAPGEAVLLVTPAGRSVFVADGRGEAEAALARAAALRPGWSRRIDIALADVAAQGAGQVISPAALAPGQALRLDDGLTLTRLAGEGAWELRYGSFATVLPATLSQAEQAALVAGGAFGPLTVLKTAEAGTGAWPGGDFIVASGAQLILWPEETTYPPAVAALLAARGATRTEAGAVVEIVSDGQRYWWRQWAATARP